MKFYVGRYIQNDTKLTTIVSAYTKEYAEIKVKEKLTQRYQNSFQLVSVSENFKN